MRQGQEHQMVLRPTARRARGPEGLTETMVAHVMREEVMHHGDAVAVSDPSQHMIALF